MAEAVTVLVILPVLVWILEARDLTDEVPLVLVVLLILEDTVGDLFDVVVLLDDLEPVVVTDIVDVELFLDDLVWVLDPIIEAETVADADVVLDDDTDLVVVDELVAVLEDAILTVAVLVTRGERETRDVLDPDGDPVWVLEGRIETVVLVVPDLVFDIGGDRVSVGDPVDVLEVETDPVDVFVPGIVLVAKADPVDVFVGAIEFDLSAEELDVVEGAIDLVADCVNSAVGVSAAILVGRRE